MYITRCKWLNKEPTGSKYRGCQTQSISGLACGNWEEGPFDGVAYTINPKLKKQVDDGNMNHNYCRNVDGASNIWCFTLREKRFEACKQMYFSADYIKDHYNFIPYPPLAFRQPIVVKSTAEYVRIDQYVFNTTFELESGQKVWSAEFVPICDDQDRDCQIRQYKAKVDSADIEKFHSKVVTEKKDKKCVNKRGSNCQVILGSDTTNKCDTLKFFARENCPEYCGLCDISKLPAIKKTKNGKSLPLYHPDARYFPEADKIIEEKGKDSGEEEKSNSNIINLMFLLFLL